MHAVQIPESYCSGNRIIAMDDGKHSFDKLIHVQDLLQVLLAQLRHLQHAESQKVVPNTMGEITECFTQYKTFQF